MTTTTDHTGWRRGALLKLVRSLAVKLLRLINEEFHDPTGAVE
ncbi:MULTISPECIES: hypothetical protein [Streptomyces]|uniref:Uncharacterized protein n=1 Tax=Streptomyces fimbriatus TaxID=68197 RepID=A0ABW0DI23_STRFI